LDSVVLASISEIAPGQMRQYQVNGQPVLVCNVDGRFHALEAICPHRGAMLAQGRLEGDVLVCPWHEWAFDVTSGQGISNPFSCLMRHNIRVSGYELHLVSVSEKEAEIEVELDLSADDAGSGNVGASGGLKGVRQ
jgi:nitrite reductase/ring-hydroxylating ferredoxin subunit